MRDNDAIIGAAITLIQAVLRQTDWQAIPEDPDDPQSVEAAEFLDGAIGDMSMTWADFMSEVLSMLWFGWSYFEKVFKIRDGDSSSPSRRSKFDDGRIGWRKIEIRAQETLDRWQIDEDGGIRGLWQVTAQKPEPVFIPIEKSILFRTERNKNNPEGRSMLRNTWRTWYFVKRIQELEAIGIERDAVGYPDLQLPESYFAQNASPAKRQALANFHLQIKQLRRNELEGMVRPAELNAEGKPTGYKFQLVKSGGPRQFDINATIQRLESREALTLLTQFQLLGQDSVGSFALSSDQTATFAIAMGAILDTIEETFHRFATVELMKLNGYQNGKMARWTHGDIEKQDMKVLMEGLATLVDSGLIIPDRGLDDHLREKLEVPPREEDEEHDHSEVDPRAGTPRPENVEEEMDDSSLDQPDNEPVDDIE